MKAARMLKSQSGFSLIELMIVVAIIGILASIAVPNFKKFQVKARQSEAKSQLTSLYTAEKAFYGEWTGYHGDFRDIGYAPEGRMRYNVGFSGPGFVPATPFNASILGTVAANQLFNTVVGAGGAAGTLGSASGAGFTYTRDAGISTTVATAFAAATALGNCGAEILPSQTQFRATAHTTTQALGSDRADIWTIDDAKSICNNQSGI